ncbi:MAG TPA: dihydrofolate reductase family protein, partial [Pyrinomonadaceae bacterium]|nr:dihydrofolate reductase family protein [Pyrinomonadaceae bacterium]
EEAMELMKDMWSRFDTMVMGRKTWDIAAGTGGEGEKGGKRDKKKKKKTKKNPYGDLKSYVFSRTLNPGERDGIVFTDVDPGEFVRELKAQDGKDICVMGGGELGTALLEAGVIDEIGFNIHPLLLGSGVPLFHKMKKQVDLELIECKPMKNGCVYLLYKVK